MVAESICFKPVKLNAALKLPRGTFPDKLAFLLKYSTICIHSSQKYMYMLEQFNAIASVDDNLCDNLKFRK